MERGSQTSKPDDGGKHHVDALHLHEVDHRGDSCEDLDAFGRQSFLDGGIFGFVGNDDGVGVELQSLLYKESGIAAGAEHLDRKEVAMATDDVERLRAYRTCGTQYGYSFHLRVQNEMYSSGLTGVPLTQISKWR